VSAAASASASEAPASAGRRLLAEPAYWTLTVGFGLALVVQVGFLVHQLNLLSEELSDGTAARVVSATTVAALVGRLVFGALTRRLDGFALTVGYLVVQAVALAVAAVGASSGLTLTLTSVAFGLGVGTLVTATPLLTRLTFPDTAFERTYHRVNVGLQAGAALGPLGATTLHDLGSGYPTTLATMAAMDAVALVLIACTPKLTRADRRP
jgi:MFS family permease